MEFSYQLPPDLKLTLNPKGHMINDDDDDECNPFQREEDMSPIRDIETMDIEVDAAKNLAAKDSQKSARHRPSVGIGEPEPECIATSPEIDQKAHRYNT